MKTCDDFRDSISLYIDQMLTAEESEELKQHLSECSECMETYNEIVKITDELSSLEEIELPLGFHMEAMSLIKATNKRLMNVKFEKPRFNLKTISYQLATAAAGLVITAFLFSGVGSIIQESTNPELEIAATKKISDGIRVESPVMQKAASSAEAPQAQMFKAEIIAVEPVLGTGVTDNAQARIAVVPKALGDPMIKTYNITIEVDDIATAMLSVEKLSGYNSYSNAYDNDRVAFNRVVASKDYDDTKNQLRSLGKVLTDGENVQRIFYDINDVNARLSAKEEELGRLFEILKKSTNVNAMLKVETRLENVRYELDNYKSQSLGYSRSIENANINVSLIKKQVYEQTPVKQSMGERISKTFISSLNATIYVLEGLTIFFVSNAIQIIILLVFIFLIIALMNRMKRRRGKNE